MGQRAASQPLEGQVRGPLYPVPPSPQPSPRGSCSASQPGQLAFPPLHLSLFPWSHGIYETTSWIRFYPEVLSQAEPKLRQAKHPRGLAHPHLLLLRGGCLFKELLIWLPVRKAAGCGGPSGPRDPDGNPAFCTKAAPKEGRGRQGRHS